MARYAQNTSVSSEMSRLEIEKILIKYGAQRFVYATVDGRAMIGFTMNERQVKFILPLPGRNDEEVRLTATGRERSPNSRDEAWEQACRQRWRAYISGQIPAMLPEM